MYLVIHESRDSSRKFILKYDVNNHEFSIENEKHEKIIIEEYYLYHALDDLIVNTLHRKYLNDRH